MVRARNLILALCGAAVVGALVLVGAIMLGTLFDLSDGPAPPPEALGLVPETPEVSEANPDALERPASSGTRTTRVSEEIGEEGEPPGQAIELEPTPTGFAVAGVVHFSDDGAPAPGLSFSLHHPGGDLFLETDEEGRFTTDPVIQPGVSSFRHQLLDSERTYRYRLEFEPQKLTLDASVGEEVTVELSLLRPDAELNVLVVHRDGRPAPGALVQLQYLYVERPGEAHANTDVAVTLDDGIGSFALYGLEKINAANAAGVVAYLEVKDQDGEEQILSSDLLHLEFPLQPGLSPEPLRLILDESGSILIRVKDTEGAPVAGKWTFVLTDDPHLYLLNKRTQESDERGEILVRGLPPRTYTIRPLESSPGGTGPEVVVHPGEISEVEFVLPATRRQLAVSGAVVDEAGEPLGGVHIHVEYGPRAGPGDTSATAYTDKEGHFEFHAAPCDGLTVTANRDLFGHQYDPASLELPFRALDVQFRRVRKVELTQVSLEIVDSVSGERLDRVLLLTYRAPNQEGYSFHRAKEGLASPFIADHPDTTIVFELTGYRRFSASLEELEKLEPVEGLRRVRLESGLLRALHVEGDAEDGEAAPVVGAVVLLDGARLGSTDEAGEFLVDLHSWPEQGLTIEAEGFSPATWLPTEGFSDVPPAWVWLERE